ncbi:MAG TPA: hypothetical protein VI731_07655 [Bacteroidia bacterium]|nr:hypothetical protein [Bacteroidia bacterium]
MKGLIFYVMMAIVLLSVSCNKEEEPVDSKFAEDEELSGFPGENLDLFTVLDVLRNSSTPADFEKQLNQKSTRVNNLDLDADGKVDFLHVTDQQHGDAHLLTIRYADSEKEIQDIAVIEIMRITPDVVHLQIAGDVALYGKNYIVEPKNSTQKAGFDDESGDGTANVSNWKVVEHLFASAYVTYISPYGNGRKAPWFESWSPVEFEIYYPVVAKHHKRFQRADGFRFVELHEHYAYNMRKTAPAIFRGKKRNIHITNEDVVNTSKKTIRKQHDAQASADQEVKENQRKRSRLFKRDRDEDPAEEQTVSDRKSDRKEEKQSRREILKKKHVDPLGIKEDTIVVKPNRKKEIDPAQLLKLDIESKEEKKRLEKQLRDKTGRGLSPSGNQGGSNRED